MVSGITISNVYWYWFTKERQEAGGRRQEAGGREYIFCPLPQGLKPLNLFMQNTKTCIARHVVREILRPYEIP